MTGRFVLDASVAACWAFHDETDARANVAAELLSAGEALVPGIWWYEVRNTLIIAERRGRVSELENTAFLADLSRLPIHLDSNHSETGVLRLARQHRLSVYDAAYLELSVRTALPLATLDRALAAAAQAIRVGIIA